MRKPIPAALFWVGLISALAAVAFLVRALTSDRGLEDLAFVTVAAMAMAVAGLLHGAYLLAAARSGERQPRARIATASVIALLGLLAAARLLASALPASQWRIVAPALFLGAVAALGLARSPRLWRA